MAFDDVMRLAQQRGFFFKTADSYPNSPAGFWDYGPLGVAMRNRFVGLWRRSMLKRDGMIEIDGAQILPRAVFEASGHLSGFTDPFVKCSKCGSVFRPDKLIEEKTGRQIPEKLPLTEYDTLMDKEEIRCQKCGSRLSGTERFNMMFRVGIGPAQEEAYLRPETCQSIFVDFPLLFKTQRIRLPVGVAQVGRSFRNEIAPRQGLLRMRELNQAEVEVFFNPARIDLPKFKQKLEVSINLQLADGSQKSITVGEATDQGLVPNLLVGYYLGMLVDFYREAGLSNDILRFRMLSDEDRAFYSRAAYDLEARLSVGWVELVACNYRGDYDLGRHSKQSGTDFTVEDGGEKVLPHIFELSMGVDRSLYAIMEASLKGDGDRRALMIKPYLSPIQAGVFPLVNKDGIPELAEEIHATLSDEFEVFYDDGGSIGKRYARADEAGIPCCITIDYDSLKDKTVTIRDRDSRAQERVKVEELGRKLRGVTSYPSIFGQ